MKIKEIAPDNYLQTVLKKIGPGIKQGEPMPKNIMPKGTIRSSQAKQMAMRTSRTAQNNLIKTSGSTLPIPVGPNKEKNMMVKPIGSDKVQITDPKPDKGKDSTVTIKKKDLDPVINNLIQRGMK